MSVIQIISLVIGGLAIGNLAIVLIMSARSTHREQASDTSSAKTSRRTSPSAGPFPPDDAKPLTPEQMSEVYTQYKIAGGYKPTPIKKTD